MADRKFMAQEIREEGGRVCYEIRVEDSLLCENTLLCIVWIPAKQKKTHGEEFLTEWCRRHEESLKNAGIVSIDLNAEALKARATSARSHA
jgi:hypothetical protein